MIVEGKLNLTGKNDDYTIFDGGRNVNISEFLNLMLLEDVSFKMTNIYNGETLVDISGLLVKKKVAKYLYLYYVDDIDIDSILWNSVGRRVRVESGNVTKRFIDENRIFERLEG